MISGDEWIGGRLVSPFYVTEGTPFRPDMILRLEWPSDLVVGTRLIDPREPPVSVAQTLVDAMRHPLAGPPRRPRRVRLADASLAAELRPALGGGIPVVVAPAPELDRVIEMMAESMPAGSTVAGSPTSSPRSGDEVGGCWTGRFVAKTSRA